MRWQTGKCARVSCRKGPCHDIASHLVSSRLIGFVTVGVPLREGGENKVGGEKGRRGGKVGHVGRGR